MVRKEKNLGETKEETLSLVEVGWLKREQGGERKRLEWSCPLQLVFSRFFLLLLSTFIFHHLNFVELWNSFTWFSLSWHLLIFDVEKSSIIYRWPCPLDRLSVTSPPTRVHIENSTPARKLEMLQHYLSWQVKHCLDWVGAAIILSWDDWLTQRLGENCWKGKDSSPTLPALPHLFSPTSPTLPFTIYLSLFPSKSLFELVEQVSYSLNRCVICTRRAQAPSLKVRAPQVDRKICFGFCALWFSPMVYLV